jgi:hypothetical protein
LPPARRILSVRWRRREISSGVQVGRRSQWGCLLRVGRRAKRARHERSLGSDQISPLPGDMTQSLCDQSYPVHSRATDVGTEDELGGWAERRHRRRDGNDDRVESCLAQHVTRPSGRPGFEVATALISHLVTPMNGAGGYDSRPRNSYRSVQMIIREPPVGLHQAPERLTGMNATHRRGSGRQLPAGHRPEGVTGPCPSARRAFSANSATLPVTRPATHLSTHLNRRLRMVIGENLRARRRPKRPCQ